MTKCEYVAEFKKLRTKQLKLEEKMHILLNEEPASHTRDKKILACQAEIDTCINKGNALYKNVTYAPQPKYSTKLSFEDVTKFCSWYMRVMEGIVANSWFSDSKDWKTCPEYKYIICSIESQYFDPMQDPHIINRFKFFVSNDLCTIKVVYEEYYASYGSSYEDLDGVVRSFTKYWKYNGKQYVMVKEH